MRLPRHPQALAVLRAIRDGQTVDEVVASIPDAEAALRALTRGTAAILRPDPGARAYRVTTRGRELLALDDVPTTRTYIYAVTRPLSSSTAAVLDRLVGDPSTWTELRSTPGLRLGALANAVRAHLVEERDGRWHITARGLDALRARAITRTRVEHRHVSAGPRKGTP